MDSRPPLAGAQITYPELAVEVMTDQVLASVALRRGQRAALEAALHTHFGLALPGPGKRLSGETMMLAWSGREQWFASAPSKAMGDIAAHLGDALGNAAAVSEQTDAWLQVRVRGAGAYALLERLCPLDLDPGVFAVDAVARTSIEHLGVQIAKDDDTPTFTLMSPSSSASSFWQALMHAAASACTSTS